MKSKHRLTKWIILGSVILLAGIIVIVSLFLNVKTKIDCFVYDPCGGCFTEEIPCKPCKLVIEMDRFLSDKANKFNVSKSTEIKVHNVMYNAEKSLLNEKFKTDNENEYPIIFVGKAKIVGWEEINAEIDKLFSNLSGAKLDDYISSNTVSYIQEKTDKPRAVYFKMSDCRECKQTEKYLEEKNNFEKSCEIVTYDLKNADDLNLFNEYCEKYKVDSKTAGAPIIFIGDKSLEGFSEIETFLESYISAGFGLETCIINAKKTT